MANFLDKISSSELFFGKLVDVGNRGSSDSSRDEINLLSVDVLDDHDVFLGEEMESEVGDGLSENRLLKQKHVGTGGKDLLHELENVLSLFLEESIHSSVVVYNNVALEIRLGCRERELKKTDSSLLDASGTASEVRGLLVNEDKTIDKFRVVDRSTEFLSNMNVSKVDVVGSVLVDNLKN